MAGPGFGESFLNAYLGYARMAGEAQARKQQMVQESVRNAMEQERIDIARKQEQATEGYRDAMLQQRDAQQKSLDNDRMVRRNLAERRVSDLEDKVPTDVKTKIEKMVADEMKQMINNRYTDTEAAQFGAERRAQLYETFGLGRPATPLVTPPQTGGMSPKGTADAAKVAAQTALTVAQTDQISSLAKLKADQIQAGIELSKARQADIAFQEKFKTDWAKWQKYVQQKRLKQGQGHLDLEKARIDLQREISTTGQMNQFTRTRMGELLSIGRQQHQHKFELWKQAKSRMEKAQARFDVATNLLKTLPPNDTATRPEALAVVNEYTAKQGPSGTGPTLLEQLRSENEAAKSEYDKDTTALTNIDSVLSKAKVMDEHGRGTTVQPAFPIVGPTKGSARANVPSPKSKAEYDKLPRGAKYRAPDGSIRTKG